MAKILSIGPIQPREPVEAQAVPDSTTARRPPLHEPREAGKILFERLGLEENPFGFTPNPRYLFESQSHREARASLIVGLECGVGFQALIAPPGMGKTTLLFDVVERFNRVARTAFLLQLQGDARDFLLHLAVELGCELRDSEVVHAQQAINQLLIRERRAGRRTIIVIDEAQTLTTAVLEMIRLLSNFETSTEKLVQIVLAGQLELAQKLSSPELVQLRQRISIAKTLTALDFEETTGYIEHRLRLAGYHGQPLFTPRALNDIAVASKGIPREINTICFNALLLLTAASGKQVDSEAVEEVIADLQPVALSPETHHARSHQQANMAARDISGVPGKVSWPGNGKDPVSYRDFYHFKKAPFEDSLDPSSLCSTATHSAALATLYSAVIQQERIAGLIGAPGTGKSLVAACLSDVLKRHDISARFAVARQLPPDLFQGKHFDADFLSGAVKVLVVDDAQDLSLNAWRGLLTDFLSNHPAGQLVLIGRPHLEQILEQHELQQLRGRTGVHPCQLRALDEAETENYIAWRIGLAMKGPHPRPVFTGEAIAAVACYARGIPGLINRLCEGALIRGCTLQQRTISAALVHEAAKLCLRGEELQHGVPRGSETEVSEVLSAAQALMEFHAGLKGVWPESGRRRCDGGKRYRDSLRKSDSAHR
jgi:general secretion pathway protein A